MRLNNVTKNNIVTFQFSQASSQNESAGSRSTHASPVWIGSFACAFNSFIVLCKLPSPAGVKFLSFLFHLAMVNFCKLGKLMRQNLSTKHYALYLYYIIDIGTLRNLQWKYSGTQIQFFSQLFIFNGFIRDSFPPVIQIISRQCGETTSPKASVLFLKENLCAIPSSQ